MLVLVQLRGGLGLDLEPAELVGVERGGERQYLQGHAAIERDLDRFVDDPHASASDDAQHVEIAQLERTGWRPSRASGRRANRPPAAPGTVCPTSAIISRDGKSLRSRSPCSGWRPASSSKSIDSPAWSRLVHSSIRSSKTESPSIESRPARAVGIRMIACSAGGYPSLGRPSGFEGLVDSPRGRGAVRAPHMPLFHGGLGDPQHLGGLGRRELLQVPQDEDLPVPRAQFIQRLRTR